MNKIIKEILGEDNIALLDDIERIFDQIGAYVSDYAFEDIYGDSSDMEEECLKILIFAFIDCDLLPCQSESYEVMMTDNYTTYLVYFDSDIEITEEDIKQFEKFEEITEYKIKY